MNKIKLPPQFEKLSTCPNCNGAGRVKPMFHTLDCTHCGGLGHVDTETGEAVDSIEAVLGLRELLSQYRGKLKRLQYELHVEKHGEPLPDPYKGSGKYKGD